MKQSEARVCIVQEWDRWIMTQSIEQDRPMQRLTIAERLSVVALLPLLVVMLAGMFGPAWLWPPRGLSDYRPILFALGVGALALGLAYAVARSLSRPLTGASDTPVGGT